MALSAPSGGLLGYLNTNIRTPNATQTTTPAAVKQQTTAGLLTGQKPVMPITSQAGQSFAGIKAKSPGGLGNNQSNTLSKPYVAPVADQTVGTGGVTPTTTQSDPLFSAVAKTPAEIAAATGQQAPSTTGATTGNTGSGTTATGIIGSLMGTTAKNQAEQTALTQEKQALEAKYAGLGGDLINSPLAGGANGIGSARQAQLSNTEQSALANMQQEQATLAGYQTQAQGAAGTALGALTSTTQTPYGTPVVYTATGQPVGGTGATGTTGTGGFTPTYNPTQDAQQFGTAVMNGTMTYAQAASDMGYTSIGKNTLDQAITKMGGDPLSLEAQGAASQSNIQTSGTTGTNTASAGYQTAAQNYQNNLGLSKAADGQAQQVTSLLSSLGLNQGVPAYNTQINKLQTQLGSTAFTKLNTSIAELQNMYSNVLNSSGMTPTTSESQALNLLNPNSTASQINATIGQLNTAIYNRQQGLYSVLQGYNQNLGGNQNGTTGTTNYNF